MKDEYQETNEAIREGFINADQAWKAKALDILRYVCLSRPTFTVNDFRDQVKSLPFKTHDNRAMGGVMQRGKALGWMEKTGESIPSRVGHLVPIQIWRSKLYGQKIVEV